MPIRCGMNYAAWVPSRAGKKAQRAGVKSLYRRGLVKGPVYAVVDGSGVGTRSAFGLLGVCVSGDRPLLAAWRLLTGDASKKRAAEAAVTKELVEQVLAVGGPGSMQLLLADALSCRRAAAGVAEVRAGASTPWWPCRRTALLYQDVQGLARGGLCRWTQHSYVRTVQGHKQRRVVEVTSADGLTSWDSFLTQQRRRRTGRRGASLWCCLDPRTRAAVVAGGGGRSVGEHAALAGWLRRPAGLSAALACRRRQLPGIERGLGSGGAALGSPDEAAARGRVTLTMSGSSTRCGKVYRSQAGQRLARKGIRRLRREYQRELGAAPVVVYMSGCYAALAVEELLAALGRPVRESLLPFGGCRPIAPAPT